MVSGAGGGEIGAASGAVAHVAGASITATQVPGFTHADHDAVQCYTCHENTDGHGRLTVTTITDCRSCHHPAEASASLPCARCHTSTEAPTGSFTAVRPVAFSVGTQDRARALAFPHDRHSNLDCARCHTQGPALSVAADLDCAGCHADHHTALSDCASCHTAAPVEAHPPTEAHVTCSGAACHQNVPFETVPRTREFCLGCHQDQREHEVGRACADCHVLPAPMPQRGGAQ
jgi:hypothetical protein